MKRNLFDRALSPLLFSLLLAGSPAWAGNRYKDWLKKDVLWIISRKEKKEFKRLKKDEERAEFVRKFWSRRDPTPGTEKNEYKEEHYRRLKYVTEHFNEGIPGWKTDRGRVYIIHGPPVSKEVEQDRIIWYYNSNPYAEYYRGAVRLEFKRGAAVFQSRNLSEGPKKSSNVPGQLSGQLGRITARPSVSARYRLILAGPGRSEAVSTSMGETDRYIADMLRSPGEVLEERAREVKRRRDALAKARESVRTQVSFEPLEMDLSAVALHASGEDVVEFSLSVPSAQLSFSPTTEGLQQARVDLLCDIRDKNSNYVVDSLDDTLRLSRAQGEPSRPLAFGNRFSVPGGEYELACTTREVGTGKIGHRVLALAVARRPSGKLGLSTPVLTQRIVKVAQGAPPDPLIFQGVRFLLPASRRFDRTRRLFLLFQVYNCRDAGGAPRQLVYDYQIQGREKIVKRAPLRRLPREAMVSQDMVQALALNVSRLEPGSYLLMVKVMDAGNREYATSRVAFELAAPAPAASPGAQP